MEYREHRISAGDGLALYVRDYGDRDSRGTILCLGGLTRNSKDFHALACRLMPDYRVLAPDYRGRGQSAYDPEWKHYEPRTYLDDVRHITTSLGAHDFTVVGTSLGGVLGMALGTAMPSNLRGVLLNDVSPVVPTDGMDKILAYMRDTSPLPDWDAAVRHLQSTFPDFPAKTPEEWRVIAEASYRENGSGQLVFDWDPAIIRNVENQDMSEIDLWPYFRSLRDVPTLSVRGERSPFVTDDTWQAMKDTCPQMMQVTVPDVGHAPSLNESEVITATKHWLKECYP